jgi:outer membrane protein
MNKITVLLFSVAVFSFAHPVFAQLEKGNFLVGGSISLNSSTTGYTPPVGGYYPGATKTVGFSFSPSVSYMVLKNFSIGAIVPFQYAKSSNDSQKSTSTNYSLGLAVRYYFPFKQWAIFPEISYAHGNFISNSPALVPSTGQIEQRKITGTTSLFKTGVGITYFVNKNVGIEGVLYIQGSSRNYDEGIGYPGNYSSSALNFDIGMQIYLNR